MIFHQMQRVLSLLNHMILDIDVGGDQPHKKITSDIDGCTSRIGMIFFWVVVSMMMMTTINIRVLSQQFGVGLNEMYN